MIRPTKNSSDKHPDGTHRRAPSSRNSLDAIYLRLSGLNYTLSLRLKFHHLQLEHFLLIRIEGKKVVVILLCLSDLCLFAASHLQYLHQDAGQQLLKHLNLHDLRAI